MAILCPKASSSIVGTCALFGRTRAGSRFSWANEERRSSSRKTVCNLLRLVGRAEILKDKLRNLLSPGVAVTFVQPQPAELCAEELLLLQFTLTHEPRSSFGRIPG